ncbi:hypothetical protein BH23PLA1_BH23PLA1_27040 [soil metagenome]
MQNKFMELVEQTSMKETVPHFEIGDTVDVHVRILEGDKERIQIFNGVVISRSGAKTREMFTVRRVVAGEGVERSFPVHSPRIADVKVKRSGKVRRAKLYFLRDRIGKAVRLKERIPKQRASEAELLAAKAQKREARKAKKAAKAEAKASRAEEKVSTKAQKGSKTKPSAPADADADAPPQEPTAEE